MFPAWKVWLINAGVLALQFSNLRSDRSLYAIVIIIRKAYMHVHALHYQECMSDNI